MVMRGILPRKTPGTTSRDDSGAPTRANFALRGELARQGVALWSTTCDSRPPNVGESAVCERDSIIPADQPLLALALPWVGSRLLVGSVSRRSPCSLAGGERADEALFGVEVRFGFDAFRRRV
jgi:hypothetical protein